MNTSGRKGASSMEGTQVTLRLATVDDKRDVWTWRNDEATRRMMKNTALIPWDTHSEWFDRVLQNPNRILLIGYVRQDKMGMIRFDQQPSYEDAWEVSINLQAAWRHQGYGTQFLMLAVEWLKWQRSEPRVLFAQIGRANLPSIRCFSKAGFRPAEPTVWFPNLQDRFEAQVDCYYERLIR